MSQGIKGHQKVQKSRGADYRKEVSISYKVERPNCFVELSGRIDGVYKLDKHCVIEEIKTTSNALDSGWSLISYLRETPMLAPDAFVSIAGQLTIIKDGSGNVYWPDFGINTIGSLQTGQGYQVHLQEPATLTYPPDG